MFHLQIPQGWPTKWKLAVHIFRSRKTIKARENLFCTKTELWSAGGSWVETFSSEILWRRACGEVLFCRAACTRLTQAWWRATNSRPGHPKPCAWTLRTYCRTHRRLWICTRRTTWWASASLRLPHRLFQGLIISSLDKTVLLVT